MVVGRKLNKSAPTHTAVRRSQLITTYGVGAILPVESESFMIAGLEHWRADRPSGIDEVEEPRLSRALGVRRLISPPSGSRRKVPMVRFPEWVVCSGCTRLAPFWALADRDENGYRNFCKSCVGNRLVPSRFVACCPRGHIEDFPYFAWVHQGVEKSSDGAHILRLRTNPGQSSLSGLIVVCSCGQSRSLEGALGRKALSVSCNGKSPWLDDLREDCGEDLVGLQRGASNVWFPEVRSALTVDRTMSVVEEVAEHVLAESEGFEGEDLAIFLGLQARKHKVDAGELKQVFLRMTTEPLGRTDSLDRLRDEEYEALGRLHEEIDGQETFVNSPIDVPEWSRIGNSVELVSRVSKLREVRVLAGFNRVAPPAEASLEGARLSRQKQAWLPAIEVLGEGIFVRLAEETVASWEQSSFAIDRAQLLNAGMAAASKAGSAKFESVTPRKLLLHSLAHALLNELSLTTGYPASSIRERIFASAGQAGILLYTATADSAGSLGGLCSHGTVDVMSDVVMRAIARAQWCSSDPVCLESGGTGYLARNLSACHSCLLTPEVSCELQNGLLDRACLVGTFEEPHGGFWGEGSLWKPRGI